MGISNSRQSKPQVNLFSSSDVNAYEDSATASSRFIDCRGFRNQGFTLIAKDSYDGNLTFFASFDDEKPDFASASAPGNSYFPVELKYKNDDTSAKGLDGIDYDGTMDGTRGYVPNTDEIRWIGVKIAGRTAGSICVQISQTAN